MSNQSSDPSNNPVQGKRVQPASDKEGSIGWAGHYAQAPMPEMGGAEMGALHIRVVALENLVIALLADASDRQLELVRNMARYITPREGSTHHPLTTHAAALMIHLVERSSRFASGDLPQAGDID